MRSRFVDTQAPDSHIERGTFSRRGDIEVTSHEDGTVKVTKHGEVDEIVLREDEVFVLVRMLGNIIEYDGE